MEDRTAMSPEELRYRADAVRNHLLAVGQAEGGALRRWWATADTNSHYRALRREIEDPAPPKAVYMRRWGSLLAGVCAICVGYLWVMRASAANDSWGRALETPVGLLGFIAALVVGAVFGWWRVSYDWNERQRKLSAACEFADQLCTRTSVR